MKNKLQMPITSKDVEEKIVELQGQCVIIDRDVAALYGVETKRVMEAVKNNPVKFPDGYVIPVQLSDIQQLDDNFGRFEILKHSTSIHAFTERGLYMLATILKSEQAIKTSLAIIDTFVLARQMSRTMESLQHVSDGGVEQRDLLQKTGNILSEIVGSNLSTESAETEIELNFAVVKIRHKITRK